MTAPRSLALVGILSACGPSAPPASEPHGNEASAEDPLCEPLLALVAAATSRTLPAAVSLPDVGPCEVDELSGASVECQLVGEDLHAAYQQIDARIQACLPDWSRGPGLTGGSLETIGYHGPDHAGVAVSYGASSGASITIDGG